MAMPPMLRWSLPRVPIGKSEKERLDREDIEAKGFVANLERLLLAVDNSPNGRFASHLAGLLAGPRGIPVTVLRETESAEPGEEPDRKPFDGPEHRAPRAPERAEETVKAAADRSNTQHPQEESSRPLDVTVREFDALAEHAVAEEAEKGYDLLFLGLEKLRSTSGDFHPEIVRITSAFNGPLAIVSAHGIHLKDPNYGPLHILVPVNGTEFSRRAAELAINIARVTDATVTALHVSSQKTSWRENRQQGWVARRRERAILNDIVELAQRYDLDVRAAVRSGAASEAILAEITRSGHNLVVMGLSRPAGQRLFLGDTAATIFEHAPVSVLFLSS
jgi:nucleotide-binding universal stress UspA family protein